MSAIIEQISRKDMIEAIKAIKLRVEKQPAGVNSLENFVQTIDFNALSASNTQIIYGRNGTGKSHLLKAFSQHCEETYETTKVLPVYIDMRELELGPVLPSIPLDDLIIRFYRLFLTKVVEQLKKFSNKVITVSLLKSIFGGENKDRIQRIDQSIEKIYSILSLDNIEERVKEYVKKVELDKENTTKLAGKASMTSRLSLLKSEAQVGAGIDISAEESEKNKETIELIYNGLAIIDYNALRKELENTISQCGATSIILLIDEWSSVGLSIQAILAEMIRKTIGESNKVFLKIVALKYFTQMSAIIDFPQRVGFQFGVDISELLDLDNLLNCDINQQEVKDFLVIVAYKHLCLELPQLKNNSIQEFEEYLCSELFESEQVFYEVVRASEGNPRDFLSVLLACIVAGKLGGTKKISRTSATRTAIKHFTVNKAPEIKNNPAANDLFEGIFNRVVQNGQKIFLVSANKALRDKRIQELWHYRFIHILDSSYIYLDKNQTPHEYFVYSMDYGKLLSVKVHKEGEKVINGMIKTVEFLSQIAAFDSIITDVFEELIKTPEIGGPLKKFTGTFLVAGKGVETANINNLNSLIPDCVVDDLL